MSGEAFTAETNIFQALLCRACKGEPQEKPCARCAGKGSEPQVVDLFRKMGMRCWLAKDTDPCVASEVETLSDAAMYHDMDLDKLLAELNALRITPP